MLLILPENNIVMTFGLAHLTYQDNKERKFSEEKKPNVRITVGQRTLTLTVFCTYDAVVHKDSAVEKPLLAKIPKPVFVTPAMPAHVQSATTSAQSAFPRRPN